MWHAWGTEVRTGFWWGDLKGKGHLQDLGIAETRVLKWIFKKCDGEV